MTGSSRFAPVPEDAERAAQASFLSSHRATSIWAREFESLVNEILRAIHVQHAPKSPTAPVVRRSPDRCIVQLGPVALTVARLKSSRDAADEGQLLIIVWSGTVAPSPVRFPEQASSRHQRQAATALWEESYVPVATSADDWRWTSQGASEPPCLSAKLAERCFERLSAAYADAIVADPSSVPEEEAGR